MQTYLDELGYEPLRDLLDSLPPDFLGSIPTDAETISIQADQSMFDDPRTVEEDFLRPYAAAGKVALAGGMVIINLPLPLHEYQPVPQHIFWDAIDESPDYDALALAGGATLDIRVTRRSVFRADQATMTFFIISVTITGASSSTTHIPTPTARSSCACTPYQNPVATSDTSGTFTPTSIGPSEFFP